MKKFFALIFYIFLLNITVFGQITGRLYDATSKEIIQNAFVYIDSANDSIFQKECITDRYGRFFFVEAPNNSRLNVLCIGYKPYTIELANIAKMQNNDIALFLEADTIMIKEVIVKGDIYKLTPQGLSINISGSYYAELGDASDILNALPFIKVQNDVYSVNGRGEAVIYINNRILHDKAELRQLNSLDIKNVKIIRHPGAEYSSTTKAVIKIITKKKQGDGLSGSIAGNIAESEGQSYKIGTNLNYRWDKLDVFGSLWYSHSCTNCHQTLENEYKNWFISELVNFESTNNSVSASIGSNWRISEKLSTGFLYRFSKTPDTKLCAKTSITAKNSNVGTNVIDDVDNRDNDEWKHYINGFLQYNFADKTVIKCDYDFVRNSKTDKQSVSIDNSILNTRNISNNKLYSARISIATPLQEGELKSGLEVSHTDNENEFLVRKDSGATYCLSPSSNSVSQTLLSCFAEYSKIFSDKIWAQVGLRNENIFSDYYNNGIKDKAISYKDSKISPTLSLTYLASNVFMSLDYRYSILRPSFFALRNTIAMNSPYDYEGGTPSLQSPQNSESSLSIKWKDFLFTIDYTQQKNAIVFLNSIYENSDSIVFFHTENIAKKETVDFILTYTPTWFGIWHPTIITRMMTQHLRYKGTAYSKPLFYFEFNNLIKLKHNWVIGNELSYSSAHNEELIFSHETFNMDLFLSKHLNKKKLKLNFRVSNLLNNTMESWTLDVNNIKSRKFNSNVGSRKILFSVTYTFNQTTTRYKGEKSTSEINRL